MNVQTIISITAAFCCAPYQNGRGLGVGVGVIGYYRVADILVLVVKKLLATKMAIIVLCVAVLCAVWC